MGLPIPNLDDKTFEEFANEARSLIARYTPEWTDHNVHDPGITFIELFAWLAEMQIYQLNRVPETHYQKFLQLVGLSPYAIQPATVDITIDPDTVTNTTVIEAGTQILTVLGTEQIVFEVEQDFTCIPVHLNKIITVVRSQTTDHTTINGRGDMYFAPFGEKGAEGAELRIGFDKKLPAEQKIHIDVALFEQDLSPVAKDGKTSGQVIPSVNLEWQYLHADRWDALGIEHDTTSALTGSGRITFAGPPDMDEKDQSYWIRCRLKEGNYEIVPLLQRILLNTVTAVQIETIKNEDLGEGRGIPEHKVPLNKAPVIQGSQIIQVQQANDTWEDWEEVDDFELSGPDDPHYMLDPETGEILFGNGLNGRIPLESQKIRAASYKTTLGSKGNIPKGQRWSINNTILKGVNLEEATGGKAAEPIEDTTDQAKKDFRTPSRAITEEDYESLALSTPGLRVARAEAIPNYHPQYPCVSVPGTVTVVVVPQVREETSPPLLTVDLRENGSPSLVGGETIITPVPGEGFLQTVLQHLEPHRLVTTDVHVIGPEYVKIAVMCTIHLKRRSGPVETEKRVRNALEGFLDPLHGGPDKEGWSFGRSVFPSEIYQLIDNVEGVEYVTGVSLSAEGQHRKIDEIIKVPRFGLVYSGEHQVEVI